MGVKVALCHDWLNGMRGGEKCLEVLCELYPESPIFTLFCEPEKISQKILAHPIQISRLQHFPAILSHYRYYLPFFKAAAQSWNVGEYDLVISLSHCVAKGAKKGKRATHICYCFTPMRYAWNCFDDYFGNKNIFFKATARFIIERMKRWDLESSKRVDHFIAISHHVKNRILQFYGRASEVIYPPVDTDFYTPDPTIAPGDFYLVVSALVPYKRVDLAIQTFNRLGRKLVIIGDGPDRDLLQRMSNQNIQWMGWQPDEVLRDHYRRARALVFSGEEDFGIVPLEVQACGRFVIAYAKGGALETVLDGKTGVIFKEPTENSLCEAVLHFEKQNLNSKDARDNAVRFGRQRFKLEMKAAIEKFLSHERPKLT